MKRSRIDELIMRQEGLPVLDREALERVQLEKLNALLKRERERGGFYAALPERLDALGQLRELPFPCTKFIIAQRISSMRDADLILVLKDGRIAERGTHEELVRLHGYYYQTYALQNDLPTEEVG